MSDEAAPPAQPSDDAPKREHISSFSKFVAPPKNSWSGALQMGTMVLVMQLNMKLQANVMLVQTVFAIVAAVVYLVSSKMPSIVPLESAASTATVFYPAEDPLQNADNPLAQFLMGSGDEKKATKWEKLTLAELEAKLAQKRKTAAMSLLMPAFFSWFLGIHYLAASQVILAPLTLFDCPLTRKYFLSRFGIPPIVATSPSPGIYGELHEAPPAVGAAGGAAPAAAPAAAQGALTASASVEGGGAGEGSSAALPAVADALAPTKLSAKELEFEKVICETWESSEPVKLGAVEYCVKQGCSINRGLSTKPRGMTVLMAVAGSTANGLAEVGEVLALGADPWQADAEGHTALHWAALHGRTAVVEAVERSYSEAGLVLPGSKVVKLADASGSGSTSSSLLPLEKGLALKCTKGLTALETALNRLAALKGEVAAAESGAAEESALALARRATLAALPATVEALRAALKSAGVQQQEKAAEEAEEAKEAAPLGGEAAAAASTAASVGGAAGADAVAEAAEESSAAESQAPAASKASRRVRTKHSEA